MLEGNKMFQLWLEEGEVLLLPRFLPDLLTADRRPGQLFDQRFGKLDLLVILPLQLANRDAGVALWIGGQGAGHQLREPVTQAGVGLPVVDHAGHQGHLFGAIIAGRVRHEATFIPAQKCIDRS